MLSNEIKKGTKMVMRGTNWPAVMFDNKKGIIRMAEVHGIYKEIGSIYMHNVEKVQNQHGQWEPVQFTKKQLEQIRKIRVALAEF